jgi:23S rRNA G2445 N2-methylase RlmL
MTSPPLDLRTALLDPGFTPGVAHFDELFAWLAAAEREDATRIERVIARAGERALAPTLARVAKEHGEFRARLIGVLGRLADSRAAAALRNALADPEPRVRRRAASALGRLEPDAETDRALQAAYQSADLAERRAIAEALGKVGGESAKRLLAGETAGDAELVRRARNARLLLERRGTRDAESAIVCDRDLPVRMRLLARCRAGLSELLAEELAALGSPVRVSASLVELEFAGAFRQLFRARTALAWGLRVPLAVGDALAPAVAAALSRSDARAALAAWTRGGVRFRLEFASGGHRRSDVFAIADAVASSVPEFVNDPRNASWIFVVVEEADEPHLVLVPRAFEDPRFAYRGRDVRAASHPTIAAALARTAGVRPDDVVWDPFVGSGLELIERALLGPCRALLGSDLEASALEAARANLTRARVTAELRLADATRGGPPGVTLILTNPPMGRRVARDGSLGQLVDAFLVNAQRVLLRGGRLVWLSPRPRATQELAASLGFVCESARLVDLGGFDAELQVLRKR